MKRRQLWVIEWKYGGSWMPVGDASHSRREARSDAALWKDVKTRVVRYVPEAPAKRKAVKRG